MARQAEIAAWRPVAARLLTGLLLLGCGLAAQARDLVWKVEGGQSTLYLVGSVHLLPERAYPLPAAYERAYAQADVVAFETDIAALNNPAAQMQLMSGATYDGGKTLEQALPAPLLQKLKTQLQASGMPLALVNGFRPWFAAVMLEIASFMASGYRADLGLDIHFQQRAAQDGKSVLPLEALDRHIELLTGMTEAQQESFLAATLDEMADLEDAPAKLFDMWREGNVSGLESIMLKSQRKYPDFYARLIRDRNLQWTQQIDRLLRGDRDAMVVVGAIHLVGSDGLPALLQSRGYRAIQQ